MASVGFAMRRLLDEGGILGPVRAFAFAMVVTAGPWLLTSLALLLLGAWSTMSLGGPQGDGVFTGIVAYAFAFSLIGGSPFHLLASRFLADRLYENRTDACGAAFSLLLAPLMLVQGVAALAFLGGMPLSWEAKASSCLLYLAINGTWLAAVFLSATGGYRAMTATFVAGSALSLVAGYVGGVLGGLTGQLLGFACGFLLIFLAFVARLDRAFGTPASVPPGLGKALLGYWPYAVMGLAYQGGAWIDKLLFWFAPAAPNASLAGAMRTAPIYDSVFAFAYMTAIPALAMFLLLSETDFNERHRAVIRLIEGRAGLGPILRAKARMVASLKEGAMRVLKVQGTVSLLAFVFAPEITAALGLPWVCAFPFRNLVLGAFFQAFITMAFTLLFYFDRRAQALVVALVLVDSNALLTLASFRGDPALYGLGYAAASALTGVVALVVLIDAVRGFESRLFLQQPY